LERGNRRRAVSDTVGVLADGRYVGRASLALHIEEAILSGRLASGAKLPSERQMAEQLGISRPVVREALRDLTARKLVEVVPNRGTFVREARSTDGATGMAALLRRHQATPRELVEARTMLECEAASLAALRAEETDLVAIEDALTRFDAAHDVLEQARYDLAFHLAVASAAHNPVIETMFGAIAESTVEMMLRSLGDREVARSAVPLHRAVAAAIAARQPDQARAAMSDHLSVAARTYGEDFDRSLDVVARRELARLFSPGITLDDLLATVPRRGSMPGVPGLRGYSDRDD
jgi:GntR family transcriptional repressor for pyruvate dehydrogenase complex